VGIGGTGRLEAVSVIVGLPIAFGPFLYAFYWVFSAPPASARRQGDRHQTTNRSAVHPGLSIADGHRAPRGILPEAGVIRIEDRHKGLEQRRDSIRSDFALGQRAAQALDRPVRRHFQYLRPKTKVAPPGRRAAEPKSLAQQGFFVPRWSFADLIDGTSS
jgi:hypothetical protein